MPSGPNSGGPGACRQGWLCHPQGLALTGGVRCLAFSRFHGSWRALARLESRFGASFIVSVLEAKAWND
jgi:hypothetical protein